MAALIKIAIIDSNTVATPLEVQDWGRAAAIQMNRDYFQGVVKPGTVTITYYGKGATLPLDAWWIAIVDNADMAGALGYHDLTASGLPLGKVFVATSKLYHAVPSVVLSHELLEMLGDPNVNVTVTDGKDVSKFWAKEVCDAVEDDTLAYPITLPATLTRPARDVLVSDFVLPAYWNPIPTKRPYSFRDSLDGPVPALAAGGYLAYIQNGVWQQINRFKTVDGVPHTVEAIAKRFDGPIDKRRIHRIIPREDLVNSTAVTNPHSSTAHLVTTSEHHPQVIDLV
jgi:hypothetical protein